MSSYKYGSLQETEIRVLRLFSGQPNSDLQGALITHQLLESDGEDQEDGGVKDVGGEVGDDVGSEYTALSYTWGDAKPKGSIRILEDNRGYNLAIKPNLEAALRELRRDIPQDGSKLLWMDALCINQGTEPYALLEKSSQIQKMALIYSQAASVIIWLGEETKDSGKALSFVQRLQDLDDFDDLTTNPVTPSEWAAFMGLMRNPWFNRRWVVQEVALARRATVRCGHDTMPWQNLANAVSLFTSRHQDLRKLFQRSEDFDNHPDFLGEVEALGAKCLVDTVNMLFRKSDEGVVMERMLSLEALMSCLTLFEASKPHDTVYAILWLAHDAEPGSFGSGALVETQVVNTPVGSPRPDISTPPLDYLTAGERHGGLVQSPMALPADGPVGASSQHHHTRHLEDVPARLPQLSGESHLRPPPRQRHNTRQASDVSLALAEQPFIREPEPIVVDYNKTVFDVCKEFLDFAIRRSKSLDIICRPWAPSPPSHEPDLPSWIPHIDGSPFGLDPADRVYRRVRADALVGKPGWGSRPYNACGKTRAYWGQKFITDRTLIARGYIVDVIRTNEAPASNGYIPASWLKHAGWHDPSELPPERFWRILVADRGLDGERTPPAYFNLACKWAFQKRIKNYGLDTSKLLTQGKCPSIATEFLRRVQAVVWDRRLISSEGRRRSKPLLGLAPCEAEKGDLICILYGCSVPVILRKRQKRKASDTAEEGMPEVKITASTPEHSVGEVPRLSTLGSSSDASSVLYAPVDAKDTAYASIGVRRALKHESDARRRPLRVAAKSENVDHYEFIGECYIHGMMAGEGFKHQREHRSRTKDFHIV